MIETKLTPRQLMKLNPWVKTISQAKKILNDVRTKPSVSLDSIVSNSIKRKVTAEGMKMEQCPICNKYSKYNDVHDGCKQAEVGK